MTRLGWLGELVRRYPYEMLSAGREFTTRRRAQCGRVLLASALSSQRLMDPWGRDTSDKGWFTPVRAGPLHLLDRECYEIRSRT